MNRRHRTILRSSETKRRRKAARTIEQTILRLQNDGKCLVFSTQEDGHQRVLHEAAKVAELDPGCARPCTTIVDLADSCLGDVFDMGNLLGTGSAGVVWSAKFKSDKTRTVAIKEMSKRVISDVQSRAQSGDCPSGSEDTSEDHTAQYPQLDIPGIGKLARLLKRKIICTPS